MAISEKNDSTLVYIVVSVIQYTYLLTYFCSLLGQFFGKGIHLLDDFAVAVRKKAAGPSSIWSRAAVSIHASIILAFKLIIRKVFASSSSKLKKSISV